MLEIVELNECHAGAMRSHDDIVLLDRRMIEQRRQKAAQLIELYVAAEPLLVAGTRCLRHVETGGTDAGEEIEHVLPVLMIGISVGHAPPRVSLRHWKLLQ